ncbi:MAG: CoA transferase [Actinomycetota bacterium]
MNAPMPLAHIKVIDLTLARAGPTAVRQFADWGADVIRVEPPAHGDTVLAGRDGPDFQNLHRNKRAITIDLKSAEGHALFLDLVRDADVLIENMRSDVKHRLGIDYETLRELNPRLVYGSLSGFGQDGPYATRPGMDQVTQGMGGLMSITGQPGTEPTRVGIPISDLSAGVYLALGCCIALLERERSGEGQWVTTSLLEAVIAMLDFQAARWTMTGEVPPQAGNHHPTLIPMGTFPTSDGHINICAPGDDRFTRLCDIIGAPELLDDPDYATSADRSRNRDALNAAIAARTSNEPMAHWIGPINDAGMPCGPINSIDETFADPQVEHLAMRADVDHPRLGGFDIVRNAVSMSRTPHHIERAAPDRGQDTDEVLAEMGLRPEQIAELRERGIV